MKYKNIIIIVCTILISGCMNRNNEIKENNADKQISINDTVILQPLRAEHAQVNGISMYFEIYGTGKPLVLIHGGGSTIETTFGRIIPLLAQHRQIIAMELQAHGRTSDRDNPESFKQDAFDIITLLQQLHIEKADFLGFSNGGQTALQIGMSYPEIAKKLIIASAFYKRDAVPAGFWEGMKNASFNDMPQQYKDAYLKVNNDTAGLHNMFNRDVQRMQNFTDWTDDDLRSITAPSLIIQGDKDLAFPEHAAAMAKLIPDCRLAIIPGGHGSYLGELTTLQNGEWKEMYVVGLFEQFLNE